MIDFWMVGMLLLHFVIVLFLLLPLLLVQSLQVLLSVVLLQHFILLELLVSLLVKVLEIVGGLDYKRGQHMYVNSIINAIIERGLQSQGGDMEVFFIFLKRTQAL